MRNGFQGFCLLIELLRKAHLKFLERLLTLRIKIMVAVSDGNIGESHVSYINCYLYREHLKFQTFKDKIVHNLIYFNTMNN